MARGDIPVFLTPTQLETLIHDSQELVDIFEATGDGREVMGSGLTELEYRKAIIKVLVDAKEAL